MRTPFLIFYNARVILPFVFVLLFNSALGVETLKSIKQQEDSLLYCVLSENNTKKKLDNYINLIEFCQLNNFDKALQYCDSAFSTAVRASEKDYQLLILIERTKINFYKGNFDQGKKDLLFLDKEISNTNNDKVLGHYFLTKNFVGDFESDLATSMDYGLKALKHFLSIADTNGLAKTYNNIGVTYDNIGNTPKAVEYYLIALDYAAAVKNYDVLISIYNNLGVVYSDGADNEKANYYYKKALDLAYSSYNVYSLTGELNNIGLMYLDEQKYKEALKYFHEALSLARSLDYQIDIALLCNNIADLYCEVNKYDSSHYYINQSIDIYIKLNETVSLATSYFTLAQLFQKQGQTSKAINNYKKIPALFECHELVLIVEEAYSALSEIYIEQNNYKKAYRYLYIANSIGDSINKLSNVDKLTYSNMQINFKSKVKEYENGIINTVREHTRRINEEKRSKLIVVLFASILAILSILLFIRVVKTRKLNNLLVKTNREIEDKKALIEISNIELNEQKVFTETLLNTIPNPVFYTSRSGLLIGCNAAFQDRIGKLEEELIGVNIKDLDRLSDFECNIFKNFVSNDTPEISEDNCILSNGDKRDIICYKQAIVEFDKTIIGVLGIIVDVTKIREAEKSLSYSKQRLKEANNAKDKFFSIMAHDLKNPFNSVLGLTHLISKKMDHFTADEIQNYANLINKSAHQIYNLLENILEWARAQSGAIVNSPVVFDISEPISECLELLDNSISQKSLKIEFNTIDEIKVCVDKNMILTVFRNILINAIKYTPEKGTIKISVQSKNGKTIIKFADNGIGIPKENVSKLFKIDQPISTPGLQNEQGTGLGLIICKEFVAQNKGTLSVESEVNKGSTFSITLPTVN